MVSNCTFNFLILHTLTLKQKVPLDLVVILWRHTFSTFSFSLYRISELILILWQQVYAIFNLHTYVSNAQNEEISVNTTITAADRKHENLGEILKPTFLWWFSRQGPHNQDFFFTCKTSRCETCSHSSDLQQFQSSWNRRAWKMKKHLPAPPRMWSTCFGASSIWTFSLLAQPKTWKSVGPTTNQTANMPRPKGVGWPSTWLRKNIHKTLDLISYYAHNWCSPKWQPVSQQGGKLTVQSSMDLTATRTWLLWRYTATGCSSEADPGTPPKVLSLVTGTGTGTDAPLRFSSHHTHYALTVSLSLSLLLSIACTHTHTHMLTYACTLSYMYIPLWELAHMHTQIQPPIPPSLTHMHPHSHTLTCTHICWQSLTHTLISTHMPAYALSSIQTHMHVHICTHTHTHMHVHIPTLDMQTHTEVF